jgi:hypothetical protein
MTDKKAKGKRSDRPPTDLAAQLKLQRDTFVDTFFKKGAEFTEELLGENERLRKALVDVEAENTSLRTQLASDQAIRDLLRKIDGLEQEKKALLSHVHEAEAVSTRFGSRHAQIEQELSNLASLHVASYHLHSTLKLPLVVRHVKEVLSQIVGARSFAICVTDESQGELWPIASEGLEPDAVVNVRIGSQDVTDSVAGTIERVFLTGVAHVPEEPIGERSDLVACLPMRVDDRAVGVIVIFSLLPHKEQLVAADYELFKLLGLHAASALVGSSLFTAGGAKLLEIAALRGLLRSDEVK